MIKFLNYSTRNFEGGPGTNTTQRFVYLHVNFIVAKQTFLKYYFTIISTVANKLQ